MVATMGPFLPATAISIRRPSFCSFSRRRSDSASRWIAFSRSLTVDTLISIVSRSMEGFSSPAEAAAERALHLAAVRKMFTECDVFVFTLGLTEAWRSLKDGSVVPVAPGVIGGSFDPAKYEFRNFTVDEVREDLEAFLSALRAINPGVKVLLTVSPVPLIATYENRHVLVSTTYSKAVLRVVAEQVMQGRDWVDYFPSYEIITGSYAGGLYYENDHREVNHLGVAHAMRCFLNNYVDKGDRRATVAAPDMGGKSSVICDEEVLAQVR